MSRAIFHVDEIREQIGTNLARLRRREGITQGTLARRLGMSRSSIANIEVGRQLAPVETLYAITEALGAPLHAAFRGVK